MLSATQILPLLLGPGKMFSEAEPKGLLCWPFLRLPPTYFTFFAFFFFFFFFFFGFLAFFFLACAGSALRHNSAW